MTKPAPGTTASLERPTAGSAEGYALIVRHGERFEIIPVRTADVVIGRDAACTIVIDDDSLSRRHAVLRFGDAVTVEDLGSRNGTFVGGHRLAAGQPAAIAAGAAVTLAEIQIFLEHAPRRPRSGTTSPRDGVVVRDAAMKQLYAILEVVAASPLRILILGETGVGKEVVAQTIHARSRRATRAYLAINCGALAESMLEGELFGYEKGAFTGAHQAKPGLFESADGGTVFLDEVGELSLATQVKLLRVLESGEVMRLGSVTPRRVDVRIVAATNRDLRARVADGGFRQDLYFRLNGTTLTVPPLRERVADIEPLARQFAGAMATNLGCASPAFERDALHKLEAYAWPGNARELKNVVERAVVLGAGRAITAGELVLEGPFAATPAAGAGLWGDVEAVERQRIVDALAATGGNQRAAAKRLGIARTTLIKRIEQFGLARPKKPR